MPSATPDYRIISIGTLAAHPLWNERGDVRTGHATCTLISVGEAHTLVNPSLPAQAMAARLSERTPVRPDAITQVFLTSFQADHRRALAAFAHAQWLIHEPEKQMAEAQLHRMRDEAREIRDRELLERIEQEMQVLERCRVAPDSLLPHVDLFPLPGVTQGTCGLLIALPTQTVLLCGDAIATSEHLSQGKVLPDCADIQQAQESFKEAVEIADVLILGRDNVVLNPLRRT